MKDIDSAAQAFRIKTLAFSAYGGVVGAIGVGYYAASAGWHPLLVALAGIVGWLASVAAIYLLATGLSSGGASVAGALLFPSGRSTPAKPDFSYEDALIARGQYERAAIELEAECLRFPENPEPRLRLARLLRDQLGKPEEAVLQFRQARSLEGVDEAAELAISRELIEVLTHRLRAPERALPELARLAQRHRGTSAGEWAERELRHWKAALFDPPDPRSPGA